MKRYIYIKESKNVNLLHLYEHIICAELREFLRRNGYFGYIDYFLGGMTYDCGVLAIEIETNNNKMSGLVESMDKIPLEISKIAVNNAVLCMLAEEQNHFRIANDKIDMFAEINKLHSTPWQTIDDYQIQTFYETTQQDQILKRENDRIRTKKYIAMITLNEDIFKDNENLLPLFNFVSRAIIYDAWFILANNRGYYALDPKIDFNKLVQESIVLFDEKVDLEKDRDTVLKLINETVRSGSLERLIANLLDNNDLSVEYCERLLSESGVLVGTKGWKKALNCEYVEKLLKHCEFVLKCDTDELVFKL